MRLRPLLPDKVRGFAGVDDRWVICATPASDAPKALRQGVSITANE